MAPVQCKDYVLNNFEFIFRDNTRSNLKETLDCLFPFTSTFITNLFREIYSGVKVLSVQS